MEYAKLGRSGREMRGRLPELVHREETVVATKVRYPGEPYVPHAPIGLR